MYKKSIVYCLKETLSSRFFVVLLLIFKEDIFTSQG